MKNLSISIITLFSLAILSCGSDDNPVNPPPEGTTLTELVAAITNNGNAKTWKIESATLINSSGDLVVTEAFNIEEDEFLFSASANTISLEHRQRNDFNRAATSIQEFLLDYYKAPLNYNLAATIGEVVMFSDASGDLNFVYENENLITGEWTFSATSKLAFNLSPKTAADYPNVPSSLTFQEVAQIPAEFEFLESLGSADILGSQSNNSIYLTYSTDAFANPAGGSPRAEGVIRYDINTNGFNNNVFHNADFFTKRAYISNNELNIVGAQFINTYDLNLSIDPISFPYNMLTGSSEEYFLLRHDIIINNDDVYIFGGNSEAVEDPNFPQDYLENILIFDTASQQLTESTLMPAPKSQAASELVDNKVYTFSGLRGFGDYETVETTSYIYDLNTSTFSSFDIPSALHLSFTASHENLIYVAGQVFILDGTSISDIDIYLGVYNTEDGTFTEIQTDLDDSDIGSKISGITYLDNKLYVVYGDYSEVDDSYQYSIRAADL